MKKAKTLEGYGFDDLERVHAASLEILANTGVVFHFPPAVELFKAHGCRTEGARVFVTDRHVSQALAATPSTFKVRAPSPDKDLDIGGGEVVLTPAYGAVAIADSKGTYRPGIMADYVSLCKLVQTSPVINMQCPLMLTPMDLDPETAHLELLLACLTYSDKPLMGTPVSAQGVRDTVAMASTALRRDEVGAVVAAFLINPLTPLQYDATMAAALMAVAETGQAALISSLIMCGLNSPVDLATAFALQNCEILAGLVLAQLVNPGTPVIYGGGCYPMDMLSGSLSIGAPETMINTIFVARMAAFYGLPSRGAGALTDSHLPDAQAALESSLNLWCGLEHGIDFIFHAFGVVGSFMALSFEKFVIDEELARFALHARAALARGLQDIDVELIRRVGPGGDYLVQPETVAACRQALFRPLLLNRYNVSDWLAAGGKSMAERAATAWQDRLASYVRPPGDEAVERELRDYVHRRKQEFPTGRL